MQHYPDGWVESYHQSSRHFTPNKRKHNTIQNKHTHIRNSLKPLIYQDILDLIKLLELNTADILDLPSYTYVTCISLKNPASLKNRFELNFPPAAILNNFVYPSVLYYFTWSLFFHSLRILGSTDHDSSKIRKYRLRTPSYCMALSISILQLDKVETLEYGCSATANQ